MYPATYNNVQHKVMFVTCISLYTVIVPTTHSDVLHTVMYPTAYNDVQLIVVCVICTSLYVVRYAEE